jgi:hypothetical protein
MEGENMGIKSRLLASLIALSLSCSTEAFALGTAASATQNPNLAGAKSNGNTLNQQDAQKQNQQKAKEGQGMAQLMGIASIALGGYMIKTGVQTNASCTCGAGTPMIISGAMAIMQGIQGLMGAQKLGQMANTSAGFSGNLGSMGPGTTKFNTNAGSSGFSFDPNALKQGKIGDIMSRFEKATGMTRDALSKALMSGAKPQDILAKAGISNADLAKAMAGASAAIKKDPNALAANNKKLGIDKLTNGINFGSMDAVASSKSAGASVGGDLMKDLNLGGEELAPPAAKDIPPNEVSAELQAEMDKAGLTDKTIFQMVRNQYDKKTPMLYGQDDREPAAITDIDLPKGL